MSYQRLAYDDTDSTTTMHDDCNACASTMGLTAEAVSTAPSIEFADYPREIRKPEITVSAAAAHLASQLQLHLD